MKWWRIETSHADNEKIWDLMDSHGLTGYGFYIWLVNHLYGQEETGYSVEFTDRWMRKVARECYLSDPLSVPRLLDKLSELSLINPQMWAEKVVLSDGILERADSYMRSKIKERNKKRKQREKAETPETSLLSPGDNTGTEGENANVPPADTDTDLRSQISDTDLRSQKTNTNAYEEAFDLWWIPYRKMCLAVNCSAGEKKQAYKVWQQSPDVYESEHFQICNQIYLQQRLKEFARNGKAIGVAHGCRYLKSDKWQEAFDREQLSVQSGVDLQDPDAVKRAIGKMQSAQKFADFEQKAQGVANGYSV